MLDLLAHQWKEKIRTLFWQKHLLLNIAIAIIGLFFAFNALAISFFADFLLLEIYSATNVVDTFTQLLCYYFLIDLIIRFSFQETPTLAILPYRCLPIKKSTLIHFPLVKSTFSFFNLIGLLLIIPFFLKNIYPTKSLIFSLIWLLTVTSFILANNYINFTLKKYFLKNAAVPTVAIVVLSALLYLDFGEHFTLSTYFLRFFNLLEATPLLIFLPISGAIGCYFLAFRLLKNNLYPEESNSAFTPHGSAFSFFKNYGEIGQLIDIELKLIFRNKRPRSLMIMSALIVLFSSWLYAPTTQSLETRFCFEALLFPFFFCINYGPFLFSWESSFFDAVLSNKISSRTYLKSKHLFLALLCIFGFILTLPTAFFSYKIVLIILAFLLFNLGISTSIILLFSVFNTAYIDLGKNQFLNYQGSNFSQFLMILPLVGTPLLIYYLHKLLHLLPYFYYTISTLGLLGIALNPYLLARFNQLFIHRKHKMAAGFRQK